MVQKNKWRKHAGRYRNLGSLLILLRDTFTFEGNIDLRYTKKKSQNLTAFKTPLVLYKWKKHPMGSVFRLYRNFEENLKRLELLFQRLAQNRLKLKDQLYISLKKRVSFLGHLISDNGVNVHPEQLRTVKRVKIRSSLKYNRASLGLVAYDQNFFLVSEKNQNVLTVY